MKKLYRVLLVLGLSVCLFGCSSKVEVTSMSFSDYYRSADGFDEIRPALNLYFSCIRKAYDDSNKTSLKSFKLADEYIEAKSALESLCQSGIGEAGLLDAVAEHLARQQLLEPFLKIEMMLSEKDLLLAADGNAKDEQWFESLNSLVWDSIDEYRRGGGE